MPDLDPVPLHVASAREAREDREAEQDGEDYMEELRRLYPEPVADPCRRRARYLGFILVWRCWRFVFVRCTRRRRPHRRGQRLVARSVDAGELPRQRQQQRRRVLIQL